jgi:hypothetical protein
MVFAQLNSSDRSVKVNKDLAIIWGVQIHAAAGKAEARAASRRGGVTRFCLFAAARKQIE